MGDARYNMGNSLMIACAKIGMHFVACTSKNYFPNAELVETCQGYAKESGATITLTEDVETEQRTQMLFTQMYGYPWASRMKYGRSVSASCS